MRLALAFAAFLPLAVLAEAYEIGEELADEAFWKSDPVLFVKRHREAGFAFTTDQRTGADSRLDGGVTCFGLPVYESKVTFGEAGGIARVELMLFATAGTERMETVSRDGGAVLRRRVRVDGKMSRDEFDAALETVRAAMLKAFPRAPKPVDERTGDQAYRQQSQTWPKTELPTRTTLTWSSRQNGKDEGTFRPGFIRLAVDGPERLAGTKRVSSPARSAATARKIADNVVKDPRGDVFIDNIPMVDQGQKGYCAVATAERVLKYYGLDVDEHEVGLAAGTSADSGTSTVAMREAVSAIGRKFRLATVVSYGDSDKGVGERIDGIVNEVRNYNKMARRMKKPVIEDDVYIRRMGPMVSYDGGAASRAMDAEVLKEMKVNGMQKSKYAKFMTDIRQQVNKGIPLYWGVTLGMYPEPGLPQANGGHMRLIIGYNDRKKEIIYSDSWGAGHEFKRMPADWAWTISHGLMYMKPLSH